MRKVLSVAVAAGVLATATACDKTYWTLSVEGPAPAPGTVTLILNGDQIIDGAARLPYQLRTATRPSNVTLIGQGDGALTCSITRAEGAATYILTRDIGRGKVTCTLRRGR